MSGAALPRLHVVTDDDVLTRPGFADAAEGVLRTAPGRVAVHLRARSMTGAALHALAVRLGAVGPCVVNDRVDVALTAGAAGVQLGRGALAVRDARLALRGAETGIGVSTHDTPGAEAAAAEGADWVFAGTIWPTPSHPDRSGRGVRAVAEAAEATTVPVLAIGGVTPERARAVRGAGGWGVAVIRGVWDAADPAGAVYEYLNALENGTG